MSRSVSTSTLAILFFFTFFAIFAAAAPTDATCGGLETEKVDVPDSTTTPNTTVVDDGTVVDPSSVNTLAVTRSGTVSRCRNRRPMVRHAYNTPSYPRGYAQATWFDVGLGACGYQNKDSDLIVALAQPDWDNKAHCNKVRSAPFSAGSGGTSDTCHAITRAATSNNQPCE